MSGALTAAQREILERRGVLSPGEVQRLARKTRQAMQTERNRPAACHSEVASADRARELQRRELERAAPEPRPRPPGA